MDYDRRGKQASLASGPVGQILWRHWNDFHDIEADLKKAIGLYDGVAMYAEAPGARKAKDVIAKLEAAIKAIQAVADANGVFDKLADAERDFVEEFGTPDDYTRRIRER